MKERRLEIRAVLAVEYDREDDGRWIADVIGTNVMVRGKSKRQASKRVKAMLLRCMADAIDHGEDLPANISVQETNAAQEVAS